MTQQVEKAPKRRMADFSRLPERFFTVVNGEKWVASILYGEKYTEPDPDYISRMLAAMSIFADSPEEAWTNAGVRKLQKWLPDTPGATTGPFEMTDLYVAESDFETGNPTFVIISGIMLESGEEFRATTGATNIQATIIGLLRNGVWPIRGQFKRGDSKDKGGKYLMFLLPPD